MRRGVQLLRQGLQQASRTLHTSKACHAESTSATFPSWLPSSPQRINTPLTKPLPGLKEVSGLSASTEPPPTEVTTLSNGVRIVSEASLGATASMGIYVNSGSIYETAQTTGASALLECLAFKATQHRDTLRVMKEVELLGANIAANGSREQMSYTIDCLRSHMPAALELLCDCVINPAFVTQELEEQKMRLAFLLANPEVQLTILTELLLREAYSGGLSYPLIPDPENLHHITSQVLADFVAKNYTGKRLVLAGAGLHHDQLVELATPMLQHLPSGDESSLSEPASQYTGGHVMLPGTAPHANLILAFEYPGGWRDIQGSVVMTVVTYLLGGGNSFSSGGPGKGMHSRLYTRVLNYYHWVHSCSSYNNTFNNTGLFGIQASCDPPRAQQMLDVMCSELESLTVPPPADQLERAKHMAISLIQTALEGKAARAEDIGRQYLTYGSRVNAQEYEEMIRAVSGKSVADFMRRVLSSKPSLAAFGDGADSVSYDALVRRYDSYKGSKLILPDSLNDYRRSRGFDKDTSSQQHGTSGQSVQGVFEKFKQGVWGAAGGKAPAFSSSSSSSDGDSSSSSSSGSSSS